VYFRLFEGGTEKRPPCPPEATLVALENGFIVIQKCRMWHSRKCLRVLEKMEDVTEKLTPSPPEESRLAIKKPPYCSPEEARLARKKEPSDPP
jgi:hypothetical protein